MSVPVGSSQVATPAAGQPNLSSPGTERPGAPDAQIPETTSTPASTEGSSIDFFKRAFNSARGIAPAVVEPAGEVGGKAAPGDTSKEPEGAEQRERTAPVPASAEGGTTTQIPGVLTLTEEELSRRVQSETDRRLAKFQNEERIRREQAAERDLRKRDPYAYVQKIEEQEETEAQQAARVEAAQKLALSYQTAVDRSVLDPIFLAIPETDARTIIDSMEDNLPGRAKGVDAALKVLQSRAEARGVERAREALSKDPGFIKEILARYGGQAFEAEPIVGAGNSAQPQNPNDDIRSMLNQVRGRSRTL